MYFQGMVPCPREMLIELVITIVIHVMGTPMGIELNVDRAASKHSGANDAS